MKFYAVLQLHKSVEGPYGIRCYLPDDEYFIPCFTDKAKAEEYAGKNGIMEMETEEDVRIKVEK